MRRVLVAALLSVCGACAAKTPSDTEAIKLLRAAGSFPTPVSISIAFDEHSPLVNELVRLIREGYVGNPTFGLYYATDKGKTIVRSATYTLYDRGISPITHQWDITRIVDKRVDPQSKAVTVIFEATRTPTPYFFVLQKLDSIRVTREASTLGSDTQQATAVLVKWENGWRVEGVSEPVQVQSGSAGRAGAEAPFSSATGAANSNLKLVGSWKWARGRNDGVIDGPVGMTLDIRAGVVSWYYDEVGEASGAKWTVDWTGDTVAIPGIITIARIASTDTLLVTGTDKIRGPDGTLLWDVARNPVKFVKH